MGTKLEVLIGVDNEEPRLAVGSCSRTLLKNLGYDPTWFREQGHLVTSWQWQRTHDGYRNPPQPEEPKRKPRISNKRLSKLEQRWANYTKE